MKKAVCILALIACSAGLKAQDLPAFTFTDYQGNELSRQTIEAGRAICFVFFDMKCGHCTELAKEIGAHLPLYANATLVWVTLETDSAKLYDFHAQFFGSAANVHICSDVAFRFEQSFGISSIPCSYVYNKDWKQTAALSRSFTADELLKYLF